MKFEDAVEYNNCIVEAGVALKNAGDYRAANMVWAILWQRWLDGGNNLPGVEPALETDYSSPYYDLAVWEGETSRLTIPIPLLSQDVQYLFAREVGHHTERCTHRDRPYSPLPDSARATLRSVRWARIPLTEILA